MITDDLEGYGPTQVGAVMLLASVAGVAFAVGAIAFGVLAVRGIGALARTVTS